MGSAPLDPPQGGYESTKAKKSNKWRLNKRSGYGSKICVILKFNINKTCRSGQVRPAAGRMRVFKIFCGFAAGRIKPAWQPYEECRLETKQLGGSIGARTKPANWLGPHNPTHKHDEDPARPYQPLRPKWSPRSSRPRKPPAKTLPPIYRRMQYQVRRGPVPPRTQEINAGELAATNSPEMWKF